MLALVMREGLRLLSGILLVNALALIVWHPLQSVHLKMRGRIRQLPLQLPVQQPERDRLVQAQAALQHD